MKISVLYLARSEKGSAKDFLPFIRSYRKYRSGCDHELVIIRKGATRKEGTSTGLSLLLESIPHRFVDLTDEGFDIHAYLKTAPRLDSDLLCLLNTFSEIKADDWLKKLVEPHLRLNNVGATGATASYESLHDSIKMISKVIWLASSNRIPHDRRIADVFRPQLELHAPKWLERSLEYSLSHSEPPSIEQLRVDFQDHWNAISGPAGPLDGYQLFKPFPNPHLRSNGLVIGRELLLSLGFELGLTKLECVRFESGLDGLPTRLARRGLESLLVGADGRCFVAEEWPHSDTFRLHDQENVLISDNQVRAYQDASLDERRAIATLTWGSYSENVPEIYGELGFPLQRGVLQLSHGKLDAPVSVHKRPLISIVIPTHNRPDLVRQALDTIVEQDYDNWECILYDNAGERRLSACLDLGDEPRIKIVRSDDFLPVTDSWNNAIDLASGDYVTLIGDDDGLAPDFMTSVADMVSSHQGPDFIYTSFFQFLHPGVAPWEPSGYVIDLRNGSFFGLAEEPFLLDPSVASQSVRDSLGFKRSFAFNMQAFCFERSFLDSIRSDRGKVFESPFPDYYLANVAFQLGKRIVVSPKPIAVGGTSRKSFGFTLFNNQEKKGADLLATNIVEDPVFKQVEQLVLPGPSYNTSYFVTMHHVAQRLGSFCPADVDNQRYRNLQIMRAIIGSGNPDEANDLAPDVQARLSIDERMWASEVLRLAQRAISNRPGALVELEEAKRDAEMYGDPAKVVELDVGSFNTLPELYAAIKRFEIVAADKGQAVSLNSATLMGKAEELARDSRLDDAIDVALVAAKRASGDLMTLADLGRLFHRLEKHGLARDMADKVIELAPERDLSHHFLGLLAMQTRDLEVAESSARRALELSPASASNVNLLAEVLEEKGDRKQAVTLLKQGTARGVHNAQTYSLLGNFHLRDGDLASAKTAFEFGAGMNEDRADIQDALVQVIAEISRADDVRE